MCYRAIIFDLDGTLIDQFEAIHSAFSETLVEMGYTAPSYEEVKRAVGGASLSTMEKLIGPTRAQEGVDRLRPKFEKVMLLGVKPLAFAKEILFRLRQAGYSTAVLTNKYGPHARETCRYLNFSNYLDLIIGADDTEWKKPQAEISKFLLSKLSVCSKDAVYIGDSPYDFETARNADMDCLLVSSGTHTFEELSMLGASLVFRDLEEVYKYLTKSRT
jgi:phosphoglycolate phosphatase